jgi:flagellar biosynthesis protein FlhF
MRVKTYIAPTNSEAMELVREGLGDDAIIISSGNTDDGEGVRIIAAVDLTSTPETEAAIEEERENVSELNIEQTVKQALIFHGAPPRLITRLSTVAANADAPNPTLALASALDALFEFSQLSTDTFKAPLMLVGPPGSGKTIVAAKLCTQAKLTKQSVKAISCDTQRAGGVEQFKAFTNILGIDLITVSSSDDLKNHIALDTKTQMQIIDTAATNPYNEIEMVDLHRKIKASHAEPILVIAAGSDPMEVADMVRLYREVGVKRFIATQMDIARRAGSILAAADSASLALCNVSVSAKVSDELIPITPVSLARLIMPYTAETTLNHPNSEAAQ